MSLLVVSGKSCILKSLLVLCLILPLVSGLKCFECTLSQEGCGPSPSTDIPVTDCERSIFTPWRKKSDHPGEEDQYQCLTTVERNATELLYTRRCAYENESNICNSSKENRDVRLVECSLCSKDYCNYAADTLKPSFICYYLFPCFMFLITGI